MQFLDHSKKVRRNDVTQEEELMHLKVDLSSVQDRNQEEIYERREGVLERHPIYLCFHGLHSKELKEEKYNTHANQASSCLIAYRV